ncbi:MAG: hypothetical protein CR997_11435 [Acidobacteria bacterium]|nr:MAG: hypothetical protein CR997_11435 [Acidobacteriota bacterium]
MLLYFLLASLMLGEQKTLAERQEPIADVFVDFLISANQKGDNVMLVTASRTTNWFRTEFYHFDLKTGISTLLDDGRIGHYPDSRIGVTEEGFFMCDSMKREVYLLDSKAQFLDSFRLDSVEGFDRNLKITHTQTIRGSNKTFLTLRDFENETLKGQVLFGVLNVKERSLDIIKEYTLEEENFWTIPCFLEYRNTFYVFNERDASVFQLGSKENPIKAAVKPLIQKSLAHKSEAQVKKQLRESGKYYGLKVLLKYAMAFEDQLYFLEKKRTNERLIAPEGDYVIKVDLKNNRWEKTKKPWMPIASIEDKTIYFDILEGAFITSSAKHKPQE